MSFTIESGIPMPKRTAGRSGSKYPFADMEVGDSFAIPGDVKAATIRSAVGAFTKRNPDAGKFAVRGTGDGLRVFRVE
jgi:hypothetical protein